MARWIKRIAVLGLVLLLAVVLTGWWLLRGSLPQLEGQLVLPGLSAPVTVQRDQLGVVTIEAANEVDAMRALGYVHAQERYFEMDLLRRTAAGELAGLFGARAIELDKRHRVHRFRARVTQHLDLIVGDKHRELQAYVDGVNTGLAALKVRPWPYLLLQQQPKPWQLADSPLVGYAMYFDLQDAENKRELAMWKIKPHLPPALYALISHDGSSWDAPLIGPARGDAELPSAEQVDLRNLPFPERMEDGEYPSPREIGSNNFAVAGSLTQDGRAIVANDMHLGLRTPNLWYRAQLRYPHAQAPTGRVDVGGFTLPGLPLVVVGSNRYVAWGFTNGYIDAGDWLQSRLCDGREAHGVSCQPSTTTTEIIQVAGAKAVPFPITETSWGPVLHRDVEGNAFSLRWTAHLPGSLSLGLARLPYAANLNDVFAIADRAAIPTQNLVAADRQGRIAWRLLGPIPHRNGHCPAMKGVARITVGDQQHSASNDACTRWSGRTDIAPALVNPPAGRLWTGNTRTFDLKPTDDAGDGGYVLGARAKQIRDDLFARKQFNERDLLAIQLDNRAVFLQRWWQLLRDQANRAKTPALSELAAAAANWEGHASADSVSYRIARQWRLAVHKRVGEGLIAPARVALGKAFERPALPQLEGVAWPLVAQRPMHLLPRRYKSWDALFEDAARDVRDDLKRQGPLAQAAWGRQNLAHVCHPLAGALPTFAEGMLCMPFDPLPGDVAMPRVLSPDFGASERMVVAPGHEADGIIHMPGGQSGHPLSPFWGAGHDDWVQGRPTPFLPGPAQHTLKLAPP